MAREVPVRPTSGTGPSGDRATDPKGAGQPDRRRSGQRPKIRSGSTPSTTRSFWRLVAPATMRMLVGGTSTSPASSRIRAMFALPPTAGAPTRTRSAPSTTPSIRSPAVRGVRRTAKRTMEDATTSEGAPEHAEHDEDDEAGPVDHPALRKHRADRAEQRLRRLDQEGRDPVPAGRVHPGHHHPPEHEGPQRHQQQLDEVEQG